MKIEAHGRTFDVPSRDALVASWQNYKAQCAVVLAKNLPLSLATASGDELRREMHTNVALGSSALFDVFCWVREYPDPYYPYPCLPPLMKYRVVEPD